MKEARSDAFFFPLAHTEIDWSRGYELLDKELRRVAPKAEFGPRRADKRVKDVVNLFRFIDWVMQLSEDLEEGFWQEIQAYEEARHMPYITSVERIGIRKGIEQGRQEGRQEGIQEGEALVLRRLLTGRFGLLPPWVEERLAQADPETLERWAERLLESATLEEVFEAS